MRRSLVALVLVSLCAITACSDDPNPPTGVASGCGSGASPGTTTESLEFEGRDRSYRQVLPLGYDDATPLPIVLNWHGLGSNGADQVSFSGYGTLAEAETFVVIAPTGLPDPMLGLNSWELDQDDPTRDDLAFADALLDRLIDGLCVDPTRVYSTGMSNGGYFTSLLVCHRSERIAAAASVAALTHPDDCDPTRVVPFLGFHGTADTVVPYAGGGQTSLAPGTFELFEPRIDDEFAEFATGAGCDVDPDVVSLSAHVTSFDYTGCPDDTVMTFYEIDGGGHTWPGSLVSLLVSQGLGMGVTTTEIDATAVSWAFFEQYALDP